MNIKVLQFGHRKHRNIYGEYLNMAFGYIREIEKITSLKLEKKSEKKMWPLSSRGGSKAFLAGPRNINIFFLVWLPLTIKKTLLSNCKRGLNFKIKVNK